MLTSRATKTPAREQERRDEPADDARAEPGAQEVTGIDQDRHGHGREQREEQAGERVEAERGVDALAQGAVRLGSAQEHAGTRTSEQRKAERLHREPVTQTARQHRVRTPAHATTSAPASAKALTASTVSGDRSPRARARPAAPDRPAGRR